MIVSLRVLIEIQEDGFRGVIFLPEDVDYQDAPIHSVHTVVTSMSLDSVIDELRDATKRIVEQNMEAR